MASEAGEITIPMDRLVGVKLDGVKWGPIGKEVYKRTYSRLKPDGTKEEWKDTVERVVDGNLAFVDTKYHEVGERDKIYKLIYRMDMIPAGRHLSVTGIHGRQFVSNCHSAGFNRKDLTEHFTFTFDELMKGGGVGSNYSNRYIQMYPPVFSKVDFHVVCNPSHPNVSEFQELLSPNFNHHSRERFVVEDSREGWCAALSELLRAAWDGRDGPLIVDVSMLRERGAPLRSFGGKSSGPAPLVKTLRNVAEIMNSKVGKKLTSLDMMEIDHELSKAVVAGGIRRSARMSIKYWRDPDIFDFIHAKKEESKHWTTNISIEVDEEFFRAYRQNDRHALKVLREAALGMHRDGEPGFWNSSYAAVGEVEPPFTTNPCVTGDTLVATPSGWKRADEFKVGDELITAQGRAGRVKEIERHERVPVYKVTFSDGGSIKVTAAHQFHALRANVSKSSFFEEVMLKDLGPGDIVRVAPAKFEGNKIRFPKYENVSPREMGFMIGVLLGDGCYTEDAAGQSGVRIATDHREEGWNNAMRAVFSKVGVELHVVRDNDRWHTARVSGAGLKEFVRNLDLPPARSYEKRIPLGFINADTDFRLGLLDGIVSTDGNVSTVGTQPTIRISTTSPGMVEDIRLLLLGLGIVPKVYQKESKGGTIAGREIVSKHACYDVCIFGSSLVELARMLRLTHPGKEEKLEHIRKFCSSARNSYKVKIQSIEEAGEAVVYDLFEPVTDTWITNGYVSRGCGEVSFQMWDVCLTGDTMVLTSRGYRRIDELVGQSVSVVSQFGSETLDRPGGIFEANVFESSAKSVRRIHTRDGRTVSASLEHPFLVLENGPEDVRGRGRARYVWKKVADLKVGDRLVANTVPIAEVSSGFSRKHYALGHFLGDGWFHKKGEGLSIGVCAGSQDADLVDDLRPVWQDLIHEVSDVIECYGTDVPEARADRHGVRTLTMYKPTLGRLLKRRYGFEPVRGPQKQLPSEFWTWSATEKASFLRGLYDADGGGHGGRNNVSLTCANPDFGKEVILALSEFGVVGRMVVRRLKDRGDRVQCSVNVCGRDNIERFYDAIYRTDAPFLKRRKEKLELVIGRKSERVHNTHTDLEIVFIEDAGVQQTYNMEVEGSRNFVANGFVTHNCNLGHVNLDRFSDKDDEAREAFRLMTRFLIRATFGDIINPHQKEIVAKNRRIGVGFFGYANWLAYQGIRFSESHHKLEIRAKLRSFREVCQKEAREYARFLRIPEPIKTTCIAPTGCLTPDTLVATDRGLVRLGSLGKTDGPQWQDVNFKVSTDEGPRTATKFFVNGMAEIVTVETRHGYRIRGTPGHKIKVVTPDGDWIWKKLSELEEDDIVPLQMNQIFGSYHDKPVELPPFPQAYHKSQPGKAPVVMSDELAEFLGFFMGNGSIHEKGIRLAIRSLDTDVINHFAGLGGKLFGVTGIVTPKEGYTEFVFNSVRLARWFELCGFDKVALEEGHSGKGYLARIPDAVLATNSRAHYLAFLRGLFEADGSISMGVPELGNKSFAFITDVKTLMLALGYPTSTKIDIGGFSGQPVYKIRLLNRAYVGAWKEEIGFIGKGKMSMLRPDAERHQGDLIPLTKGLLDKVLPISDERRKSALVSWNRNHALTREMIRSVMGEAQRKKTGLDDREYADLGKRLGFFYDTISRVEVTEDEMTFDLSVPENVTYVANGFVSHNTISNLPGVTSGCQPIFARYFIRRVRYAENDENLHALREKGYPIESSNHEPSTKIVSFFCKDPLVAEVERRGLDVSIVEEQQEIRLEDHLAVQAMLQQEYADNGISYTINFNPKKVKPSDIERALIDKLPHLKGTTLMPEESREQMPFERISKEAFDEAQRKGIAMVTDAERECPGGACPVK